jgi:creatinine amidohydrolase
MHTKVLYEELLPDEFIERLRERPIGYLPLGTIEWHGAQNALGADFIQSRGLFERAASRFGGIVFPPIWIAPDWIKPTEDNRTLIGMDIADVTVPNQQLPGSCYWVPHGVFITVIEAILNQAKRAGFECIIADGHGPSRIAWNQMAVAWERQFDIKLLSAMRDFPEGSWKTQTDHAGKNETSIMMAIKPDLVDLSKLPDDRAIWPMGVAGEDPRNANAEFGEAMMEMTLREIGESIDSIFDED